MKQYSREYERAQEQIVLLEKRRDTLQANLAVISACWLQVNISSRRYDNPDLIYYIAYPRSANAY